MNEHEIARIAAAMHQARPDWPTKQLVTLMRDARMVDRPRRDTLVALAWIACEPNTATPYRVLEAGPWWRAAAVDGGNTRARDVEPVGTRCVVCGRGEDTCNAIYPDHEYRRREEHPARRDARPTTTEDTHE